MVFGNRVQRPEEEHMQKQVRHCVVWNEQQACYEIQVIRPIIFGWLGFEPDTGQWFAWLERIPSFRFQGRRGHFTARKETRKRGSVYWIAYRHVKGKLRKQYIGVPATVTITRLEELAGELGRLTVPQADA